MMTRSSMERLRSPRRLLFTPDFPPMSFLRVQTDCDKFFSISLIKQFYDVNCFVFDEVSGSSKRQPSQCLVQKRCLKYIDFCAMKQIFNRQRFQYLFEVVIRIAICKTIDKDKSIQILWSDRCMITLGNSEQSARSVFLYSFLLQVGCMNQSLSSLTIEKMRCI